MGDMGPGPLPLNPTLYKVEGVILLTTARSRTYVKHENMFWWTDFLSGRCPGQIEL